MSCVAPFLPAADYVNTTGYITGRFCSDITGTTCCLPCPMTDWVYPDSFQAVSVAADWIAVLGTFCCVFLLVSWLALPVDKTNRHYLSICLTTGVLMMNLGFIIPLAGRPDQCADAITPHGLKSSPTCAASGAFLILGGWGAVMWVFLRSLSLHLQICWQVVVGRPFMWAAMLVGWGVPVLGMTLALVVSGLSFRFGTTCHIDHRNSLAVLWVPLLTFSALTIVVQLVTFSYCIKVYLVSLADNSASTEGSGLPSYSNSIRTMSPRQAYRRVRRVIQLQWRGIAIVLIIITDVVFFSVVFVFQDNTVQSIARNPTKSEAWSICIATHGGDKNPCLHLAHGLRVNEATIAAVLVLLAMNGLWLLFLLGRWSMVHGWIDLLMPSAHVGKREFVSVDARMDTLKKDQRSYEMLAGDTKPGAGVGVAAGVAAAAAAPGPGSLVTISSILKQDHDIVTSVSPTAAVARSKSKSAMHATFVPATRSTPLSGSGLHSSSNSDFDHISTLTPAVARTSADRHYNEAAPAYTAGAAMAGHHRHYGSQGSSFGQNIATPPTTALTAPPSGRRTPDYFGRSPPPLTSAFSAATAATPPAPSAPWDSRDSFARAASPSLSSTRSAARGTTNGRRFGSRDDADMHPLGMNRI